jgi:hypothetical protein
MTEYPVDYQVKVAKSHIAAFLKATSPEFEELYDRVKPPSMLPVERLFDLYQATRYVDKSGIAGDIVEAGDLVEVGVWRGSDWVGRPSFRSRQHVCRFRHLFRPLRASTRRARYLG